MKPIKYDRIETKVANLIKNDIRQKGLIRTGNMYNSIKVKSQNGGFIVYGIYYFEFVNRKYSITDDVFNSDEFIDLIIYEAGGQIGDFMIDQFQ